MDDAPTCEPVWEVNEIKVTCAGKKRADEKNTFLPHWLCDRSPLRSSGRTKIMLVKNTIFSHSPPMGLSPEPLRPLAHKSSCKKRPCRSGPIISMTIIIIVSFQKSARTAEWEHRFRTHTQIIFDCRSQPLPVLRSESGWRNKTRKANTAFSRHWLGSLIQLQWNKLSPAFWISFPICS